MIVAGMLNSAKGANSRRQTTKKLASPLGGETDIATVLRGFLSRRSFVNATALVPLLSRRGKALDHERTAGSIIDVAGIRVGHFADTRRPTGCTVVLFDHG